MALVDGIFVTWVNPRDVWKGRIGALHWLWFMCDDVSHFEMYIIIFFRRDVECETVTRKRFILGKKRIDH